MSCTYNALTNSKLSLRLYQQSLFGDEAGGSSDEVTPVPISNTEVKLISSDGTWTQPGPGRVARCRTKQPQ